MIRALRAADATYQRAISANRHIQSVAWGKHAAERAKNGCFFPACIPTAKVFKSTPTHKPDHKRKGEAMKRQQPDEQQGASECDRRAGDENCPHPLVRRHRDGEQNGGIPSTTFHMYPQT